VSRPRIQFTSDNRSRICPDAWAALEAANSESDAPSYGDDAWTRRASDLLRQTFETDCDVYFVFTGTAANSLALASLCQSYHSVICHETSHVETDECGAPEFFSNGTKLLLASGSAGKIVPAAIDSIVGRRSDIHFPKPRVLSLTQATELGTVYTPDELADLTSRARHAGLRTHMDGARFANAIASIGCTPAELTWKSGVDVLCLGGTKTGMMACEAIIFFDRSLSAEFAYRCKQSGQLGSKMRYLAAQWVGMLQHNAWLHHAQHANAMAQQLARRLKSLELEAPLLIKLMFPVEANSVFLKLHSEVLGGLRNLGWEIYTFIGSGARLMCSWETDERSIDHFYKDIESLVNTRLDHPQYSLLKAIDMQRS
jgi:threonine aldolase